MPTPRLRPSRNAKDVTCGIDVSIFPSTSLLDSDIDSEYAQSKVATRFRLLVSQASTLQAFKNCFGFQKYKWDETKIFMKINMLLNLIFIKHKKLPSFSISNNNH